MVKSINNDCKLIWDPPVMKNKKSTILSAILKHLKTRPTFDSIGIDRYRNSLEKGASTFKADPTVSVESFCVGPINAMWLTPDNNDNKRIILYIHGGGYIAGSIHSHKDMASKIAKSSAAKSIIFDYRLAPEHPFPDGLNDVKTMYDWVFKNYGKTHTISVVADSAGAGLAMAMLTPIPSNVLALPASIVLISPWVDLSCTNESHITNQNNDPMLISTVLKKTARIYTNKNLTNPLVSPIHNDFRGFCPTLIQTGENEILLDDSKHLARKLKQANVLVNLEVWEEMFHVWHYFARYLKEGQQAISRIGEFIKSHT